MHRVSAGAGKPPSENPVQTRGAQETSGIRVAFSLDTFFWRRKRKYRGCRSANRLQINGAIAAQNFQAAGFQAGAWQSENKTGLQNRSVRSNRKHHHQFFVLNQRQWCRQAILGRMIADNRFYADILMFFITPDTKHNREIFGYWR